ncbi:putative ABC transporter permease [Blautia sp. Marseille-P3201T]|uniref:putative ABC transporter permease n=1 Tax=Blautia sp. Marseille-P3201T TaxID=1907659 RepID=UPI0009304E18|nr:hypothetical protein [Blautia sp. Marseille-P3201T]
MNIEIAGVSLYYIISWFFVYSFLGWLWETAYVSVRKKKFVNRGFINGPLCTIYGMGAVSIYLILKPFGNRIIVLYIGGVVVATILEYLTGWLMEKIFHTRWWDYSHRKYNLQGYISLGTSLGWGVFTLLLFKVFQPFVSWFTDLYPQNIGEIALIIIMVLYAADFITSASAAFGLTKSFAKVEDMLEDITQYLHNSKLYETREEIQERLETVRAHLRTQEVAERLSVRKQEFMERFETLFEEKRLLDSENYLSKKAEMEQKLDEFVKKYTDIRKKQNIVKKRMVYAYPELKNQFKKYRKKHQKE